MKKNKIISILLLITISLFIFSGCSSNNDNSNKNQKIVKVISDENTTVENQDTKVVDNQIDNQIIADNNTVKIGELV